MSLTINSLNCCKSFKLNESGRIRIESGAKHSSSIKKSRRHSRRSGQKILLLGTGESGKSTFLKQMRIITGKSFSDSELQGFKSIIYDNIYKGVLFLLQVWVSPILHRLILFSFIQTYDKIFFNCYDDIFKIFAHLCFTLFYFFFQIPTLIFYELAYMFVFALLIARDQLKFVLFTTLYTQRLLRD